MNGPTKICVNLNGDMVLKENKERRAFNCLKVLLEERKVNFKGKIALHFKKKDFERSQ